ncbi:MAG: hypothetical protein AB4050_09220 [Synechococcus sp.]
MIGDIQQRLLVLELDILALEVELRLRAARSLPLAPFPARSQLWLLGYLPSVLPHLSTVLKDMESLTELSDFWSPSSRLVTSAQSSVSP